jgi:hypothetical protein
VTREAQDGILEIIKKKQNISVSQYTAAQPIAPKGCIFLPLPGSGHCAVRIVLWFNTIRSRAMLLPGGIPAKDFS